MQQNSSQLIALNAVHLHWRTAQGTLLRCDGTVNFPGSKFEVEDAVAPHHRILSPRIAPLEHHLTPDYIGATWSKYVREHHRYIPLTQMMVYTLHITTAREFLLELSSKGLWLYVAKFVEGAYTVVYQGL